MATPERLQDREIMYANCDQFGEDDHLLKTVRGDTNVVARMKRGPSYDDKIAELWPHLAACWNALRGLDVGKVEALLDAVRAEAALPNHAISAYNDSIRATERAISALADSIRAGGGK